MASVQIYSDRFRLDSPHGGVTGLDGRRIPNGAVGRLVLVDNGTAVVVFDEDEPGVLVPSRWLAPI